MRFRGIALLALAACLLVTACGDDEGNPSGPGTEPTASILSADPSAMLNSITLSWTSCPDADFFEYRLYRSLTAGIEADPDAADIVRITTSAGDTTYTDSGLEWSTTYYYALMTMDDEGLQSWSNEVEAATPDSGSCEWLTCYEVQGQADASPYEGQVVTVMGVVTVGGDEYYSSTSPYAVLSDPEGGAWGGLVLYGDSVGALARGDSILVTGEVQEYYGMTELSYISDITLLGTGAASPPAAQVSTHDLTEAGGAEQWEGVLVEIRDAIVTELGSYGQFTVDDGTGGCLVDDLGDYSYTPAVGDTLHSAVGVQWYSYSEWKLEPRDDNDLDVGGGGGPGDVLTCYEVQGQASSSPYEGMTVSVTGVVTVGGDEYYSSSGALAVICDVAGGPWSGLPLYGTEVAGLARGDSVTVTGTVQEYNGLTEISSISDVVIHSSGHQLPPAEVLQTGDLATSASPEQWEGVLVAVLNVTVSNDDLGYGEWSVTDGSGDCRVDDLGDYTYSPQVGNTITQLAGILWYSFSDFKIEPRDDGDITE